MYSKFVNVVEWLGDLMDNNMLTIVAISLLGVLLVYEIVMTIVLFVIKRRRDCLCNFVQINDYRRWASLFVAWCFAIFATLNLVDFNASLAAIPLKQILLPIAFLVVFHLIEFLFATINHCRCRCNCNGGEAPESKKKIKAKRVSRKQR